MPFYNREDDIRRMKAVLSGEPNLVYFVYGPINSGKTALLNRVFDLLPDNYRIFYINFRGFEGGYSKFTRAFFDLGDQNLWEKLKSNLPLVSAALEYVEKVAKKINTAVELPGEVIRMLQVGGDDPEKMDMFHYLERLMKRLVEKGYRPVLALDEIQVLKGELNATGEPLLKRLFNFMVRLTNETQLCNCLCATSDCLFIEEIYANARLEGRARYLLVDDLPQKKAFEVYDKFGFENKELIWDYINGKPGDMVRLFEMKKEGYPEKEALSEILKDEIARLEDLLERISLGKKKFFLEGEEWTIELDKVKKVLTLFKEKEKIKKQEIDPVYRNFLISENILFYNPLEGTVRPQGRLIKRAIEEVIAEA